MKKESRWDGPDGLIVMGVICIILGVYGLTTLEDQTRMKMIIGSFVLPPFGLLMVIVGIVRKIRGRNR
jgi:hypothetical protein